jgi:hypothetical protein
MPLATGGSFVTTDGVDTVHTFFESGTLHVTVGGVAEILVVGGGGGGGGGQRGNGGGAGGLIHQTVTLEPGDMPIVIGQGGACGPWRTDPTASAGVQGEDTTFAGLTAVGGGHGTAGNVNVYGAIGTGGGSGGASGYPGDGGNCTVGGARTPGTVGQGHDSGISCNSSPLYGTGGGGGAGGVGGDGTSGRGGDGGLGLVFDIRERGVDVGYAGGGSGDCYGGFGHNPGTAVHGGGAADNVDATQDGRADADAGSGGGGGGNGHGGAGVVIVRYVTFVPVVVLDGPSLIQDVTIFLDDDVTPLLGTVDVDGNVTDASFSTDPAHLRSYMKLVENLGDSEIRFLDGDATLGQLTFELVDYPIDETDQDSGQVTALLAAASGIGIGNTQLLGRRILVRQSEDGGATFSTVLDGIPTKVSILESNAGFRIAMRDIRERERKVRAFVSADTTQVFPSMAPKNGFGKIPHFDETGALAGYDLLIPPGKGVSAKWSRITAPFDGQVWGKFVFTPTWELVGLTAKYRELWDSVGQMSRRYFRVIAGFGEIFPDKVAFFLDRGLVEWTADPYSTVTPQVWHAVGHAEIVSADLQFDIPMFNNGLIFEYTPQVSLPANSQTQNVDQSQGCVTAMYVIMPVADAPADNAVVDVRLITKLEPSEDVPYYLEEDNFGVLTRNAYDGVYSDPEVPPNVPYDAAQVATMEGKTPRVLGIIEKVQDDLRKWMAESVYKATGWAPAIRNGKVFPIQYTLPDESVELLTFTDDNTQKGATWEHGTDNMVNHVTFKYKRIMAPSATDVDRSPVVQDDEFDDESNFAAALLGVKELVFEPDTAISISQPSQGYALGGNTSVDTGLMLGRQRAADVIDRFSQGAQVIVLKGSTDDLDVRNAKEGDWCVIALSWLPDYQTGRRGMNRLAQITKVGKTVGPWRTFTIIDAGPHVQAVGDPTVANFRLNGDGSVSIDVTALPDFGGPVPEVEIQFGVGATEPTTDSGWEFGEVVKEVSTVTSRQFQSGAKVWARARGTAEGRRRSLWTVVGPLTLAVIPAVSDLTVDVVDWHPRVRFVARPGTVGVRIQYGRHEHDDPAPDPLPLHLDVAATYGDTQEVFLPITLSAYENVTVRIEPWSGFAAGAVTGTAGQITVSKTAFGDYTSPTLPIIRPRVVVNDLRTAADVYALIEETKEPGRVLVRIGELDTDPTYASIAGAADVTPEYFDAGMEAGPETWFADIGIVPGGDPVIRNVSGLLFADDFNRANQSLEPNWEGALYPALTWAPVNPWLVDSNECRPPSPGSGGGGDLTRVKTSAAPSRTECCFQFKAKGLDSNGLPFFCTQLADGNNFWLVLMDTPAGAVLRLYSVVGGTGVNLANSAGGSYASGVYAPTKMWTKPGMQKVWMHGSLRIDFNSTALDAIDGTVGFRNGGTNAFNCRYDDAIYMRSNTVMIDSLPAGFKLRVAGVTVVETGGIATVDVGAADFPITTMEVLDPSNAVAVSFDPAGGIYGGDEYSYNAVTGTTGQHLFAAIPLIRDQIKRLYVQVETKVSKLKSGWVPVPISTKGQPWLESIAATWDNDSGNLRVRVKGGANCASVSIQIADNASFSSPTTFNAALADGAEVTHLFALSSAQRGKLWYVRATPNNELALAGFDGVAQVDEANVPAIYDVSIVANEVLATGVGFLTLTIDDPGLVIDQTLRVKFYVTQNGVRTLTLPSVFPAFGTTGNFGLAIALDPKHNTVLEPIVYMADGSIQTLGAWTFDSDKRANVVNAAVSSTGGTATVTASFDTDTIIGAGGAHYRVDGGAWIDVTTDSLRKAQWTVGMLSSAMQTVEIQGKDAQGDYGPSAFVLIDAYFAAGPSLTVSVTKGPTSDSIFWSGTGLVLVKIDGGSFGTPSASPIVVTRDTANHSYTFSSVLNGQTVTDTVGVDALDVDTVTPDLSVVQGTPTSTDFPFTITAVNPVGGTAPTITVENTVCSMTIGATTYPAGSSVAVATGTVVHALRPVTTNTQQASIKARAEIAGGGAEEIIRTVLNQLNVGPTLTVTQIQGGGLDEIDWFGTGIVLLSIDGGSAVTPPASPIMVTKDSSSHLYAFTATADGQTVSFTATISPQLPTITAFDIGRWQRYSPTVQGFDVTNAAITGAPQFATYRVEYRKSTGPIDTYATFYPTLPSTWLLLATGVAYADLLNVLRFANADSLYRVQIRVRPEGSFGTGDWFTSSDIRHVAPEGVPSASTVSDSWDHANNHPDTHDISWAAPVAVHGQTPDDGPFEARGRHFDNFLAGEIGAWTSPVVTAAVGVHTYSGMSVPGVDPSSSGNRTGQIQVRVALTGGDVSPWKFGADNAET